MAPSHGGCKMTRVVRRIYVRNVDISQKDGAKAVEFISHFHCSLSIVGFEQDKEP